jgi:hypothetical protein
MGPPLASCTDAITPEEAAAIDAHNRDGYIRARNERFLTRPKGVRR